MRKAFLSGILLLVLAVPGHSQLLSLGIKGGVPLNDALQGYTASGGNVSTSTNRWTVGPTAELNLPFGFSVEVDALYRRENYVASSTTTSGTSVVSQWFTFVPTTTTTTLRESLNNWQFPVLAKYHLKGRLVSPFVDGGLTYRHLSGGGTINNQNTAGVTVGGGLTFKLLVLRLSPEIRYTRWGNNDVYAPYVTNNRNQADVLVGLSF